MAIPRELQNRQTAYEFVTTLMRANNEDRELMMAEFLRRHGVPGAAFIIESLDNSEDLTYAMLEDFCLRVMNVSSRQRFEPTVDLFE